MFDGLVPRYDLLNRLMSLGKDVRWRRWTAAALAPRGALTLDVGTGTGDLALALRRQGARLVIGLDFAPQMLAEARRKAEARGLDGIAWALGDALHLPFPDDTFDCVVNAFVLRNLVDLPAGLAEMARVLRPGGRLACLDMTHPPEGPFGHLYRFYLRRLVPLLAGLVGGDMSAYHYLADSLQDFPNAQTLAALLESLGLTDVQVRLLGGGVVALHLARKPSPRGHGCD
jgi:demethylmenaquinone methyltransferase/2-methoxy-6-polyprenyl-1,4-benzoquinol methylase